MVFDNYTIEFKSQKCEKRAYELNGTANGGNRSWGIRICITERRRISHAHPLFSTLSFERECRYIEYHVNAVSLV